MSNAVVGAELLVKMAVDYADLKSGMDKVTQQMGDSGKAIESAMGLAKQAFIGFVGVASVDAFASMIRGSISAIGSFQKLSETAGVSAEALMALSKVASMSGVSADTIAGAMNKLNMALISQGEDGGQAAAGLKAIGLSYTDFMALSPDERMKAVADAMAGYKDGAGKSAVAMALFGRAGAELVPVLKDLAEVQNLTAKATNEQVAMSKDFDLTMKKLSASGSAWKDQLALGMLPALDDAAHAFLEVTNEAGGLRDGVKKLSASGDIQGWTEVAIQGFTYLLDAGSYLIRTFATIGTAINAEAQAAVSFFIGAGNAIDQFKKGQWGAGIDALKAGAQSASLVIQQSDEEIRAAWSEPTTGQKIRERIEQTKALREAHAELAKTTKDTRDDIDTSGLNKKNTAAQDESTKSLIALAGKYGALLATQQQELDIGRQLTEGEKLMVEVDKLAAEGKIKLSDSQRQAFQSLGDLADARARDIVAAREDQAENLKSKEAIGALTSATLDETAKLREKNDTMLLTEQQMAQHHISMLLAQADSKDRQADLLAESGLDSERVRLLREAADALRGQAAEEQRGASVKAAKDALDAWTKTVEQIESGITDALMRGFEAGKGFMDSFVSVLKSAFKSLVLQPTIKAIFNPIAAGLGSMLGIPSAANAATAGGSGFPAGSIMSMLSGSMGNFSGGFSSTLAGWMGGDAGMMGGLDAGLTAAGAGNIMGAAGSLGPYALAAIAAYSVIQSLDKHGGAKTEGGSGFQISSANGWNRGDTASAQALADSIKTQYANVASNFGVKDTSGFDAGVFYAKDPQGTSLTQLQVQAGMNGASIYNRANSSGFENVGRTDAEFTAAFQEASARAVLSGLQSSKLNDQISTYFKSVDAGTASKATIESMIQAATTAQQMADAVQNVGGVFGTLADISVQARDNIVGLTGGLDAFVQKTQGYVKDFYSTNEQAGITAKSVMGALSAAGIDTSGLNSKDAFRKAVDSLDLTTTQGQEQLAAFLNVESAFAGIADTLKSNNISLSDLAKQAPASSVLDKMLPKQQSTTDAVVTVGDQITTSNDLLTRIVAAVTSGNSSVASSVDDVKASIDALAVSVASGTAASTAGSAAVVSAITSASAASSSKPGYAYDIGGA